MCDYGAASDNSAVIYGLSDFCGCPGISTFSVGLSLRGGL